LALRDRKKNALVLLKLCVSAGLLFLLLQKTGLGNVFLHLSSIKVEYFILSSTLYLVATGISALRWGFLLDERYPFRRLLSLYFIGAFFNNLLPGAIGGDAVKIYYLYNDTRRGSSSFGSVFMDRYVGYAALLTIGFVSGIIAFKDLMTLGMHWVLPVMTLLFIAGSAGIFGLRLGRQIKAVSAFYDYFHVYIRKKGVMAKAFILSLIIQYMNILMIYSIARGLDLEPSFSALFVFVPIIGTAMTVPISISGFGVREGGFVLLFGMTGIRPEASISISVLWFLSIAAASLPGLILYIFHRRRPGEGSFRNN